jgi:1-acyl-sn-glycerol-3-phosphate acyltransferase
MSILYGIAAGIARVTFRTFGRFTVTGKENVPRNGPFIVVANHMSNGDPPAVVAAIPRQLHIMAKRSLFAGPLLTKMWTSMGLYPLDRGGRDVKALMWAIHTLKRGGSMLLFPEGTRSRTGGLQKAKTGAAYVALKARVPILPVGVTGTENIPGLLRVPFPFCHVRVNIGAPFRLLEPSGPVTQEFLETLTEQIMLRIAALLPEEYRGYYSGPAYQGDSEPPTD